MSLPRWVLVASGSLHRLHPFDAYAGRCLEELEGLVGPEGCQVASFRRTHCSACRTRPLRSRRSQGCFLFGVANALCFQARDCSTWLTDLVRRLSRLLRLDPLAYAGEPRELARASRDEVRRERGHGAPPRSGHDSWSSRVPASCGPASSGAEASPDASGPSPTCGAPGGGGSSSPVPAGWASGVSAPSPASARAPSLNKIPREHGLRSSGLSQSPGSPRSAAGAASRAALGSRFPDESAVLEVDASGVVRSAPPASSPCPSGVWDSSRLSASVRTPSLGPDGAAAAVVRALAQPPVGPDGALLVDARTISGTYSADGTLRFDASSRTLAIPLDVVFPDLGDWTMGHRARLPDVLKGRVQARHESLAAPLAALRDRVSSEPAAIMEVGRQVRHLERDHRHFLGDSIARLDSRRFDAEQQHELLVENFRRLHRYALDLRKLLLENDIVPPSMPTWAGCRDLPGVVIEEF